MSQNRFYSNTAVETALSSGVTNVATLLPVVSVSGYPTSFPYTIILERDTANEEICTVTSASGLNLTVTRGVDGTGGVSHSGGAVVEHGTSARDFNEPQVHIAATSGVHGTTGTIVGTSDTQTLANKTLTGPVLNSPVLNNGGVVSLPSGTHTLIGRDTTDTLTNKTLTAPVIAGPTVTGTVAGSPTITTPTLTEPIIADLTNASHDHSSVVAGGFLGGLTTSTTPVPCPNTGTTTVISSSYNIVTGRAYRVTAQANLSGTATGGGATWNLTITGGAATMSTSPLTVSVGSFSQISTFTGLIVASSTGALTFALKVTLSGGSSGAASATGTANFPILIMVEPL